MIKNGEIKIVVLQRGWVAIGRFFRKDNDCELTDAFIIRRWGTTAGLGQLASQGKQSETALDKCYKEINFDYLTVVFLMQCDQEIWEKQLYEENN